MPAAAENGAPRDVPLASLARRLLSLLYEALLLAALAMVGALPSMILAHGADSLAARPLIQLYILALAGAYFIWQWVRGGRTLPMKTWRLKLVTREGGALTLTHGVRRYLFALGVCRPEVRQTPRRSSTANASSCTTASRERGS